MRVTFDRGVPQGSLIQKSITLNLPKIQSNLFNSLCMNLEIIIQKSRLSKWANWAAVINFIYYYYSRLKKSTKNKMTCVYN